MAKVGKTKCVIITMAMISSVACESFAAQMPDYVPGELIVKFSEGTPASKVYSIMAQVAWIKAFKRIEDSPFFNASFAGEASASQIAFLKRFAEVEYAEPNYLKHIDALSNDSMFFQQWALDNTGQSGGTFDADIDAPEAWELSTGSRGVMVAMIDTGLDGSHQDMAGNVWTNPGEIPANGIDDDGNGYIDDVYGWDFARGDNDPDEEDVCSGHGTHTAGIVGARGNNGIGVSGINHNAGIMPLKVFKNYGNACAGATSDIISAIYYAKRIGARVINASYTGSSFSQSEFDTIRAFGGIMVAAAGNSGADNDLYPAYPAGYALNNIISVAASDKNDALALFSAWGRVSVDIAAPGDGILSTMPGNAYGVGSGTSMAAPHVAGAAALLLGMNPHYTDSEIRWRVLNSVDYKGMAVSTGGRLNAYSLLALPAPDVAVRIIPAGPVTLSSGGVLLFSISLANSAPQTRTVQATLAAILPDGREKLLESRTVTLAPYAAVSQSFSYTVPALPPEYYRLAARAEVPGLCYDEDIVNYVIQ